MPRRRQRTSRTEQQIVDLVMRNHLALTRAILALHRNQERLLVMPELDRVAIRDLNTAIDRAGPAAFTRLVTHRVPIFTPGQTAIALDIIIRNATQLTIIANTPTENSQGRPLPSIGPSHCSSCLTPLHGTYPFPVWCERCAAQRGNVPPQTRIEIVRELGRRGGRQTIELQQPASPSLEAGEI